MLGKVWNWNTKNKWLEFPIVLPIKICLPAGYDAVFIGNLLSKFRKIFRVVKKIKNDIFNYPEDRGSKLLRNVGQKLPINMASYPKRL